MDKLKEMFLLFRVKLTAIVFYKFMQFYEEIIDIFSLDNRLYQIQSRNSLQTNDSDEFKMK